MSRDNIHEHSTIVKCCTFCNQQQEVDKKNIKVTRSVTGVVFFRWFCLSCGKQNMKDLDEGFPDKYKFVDRNFERH